MRYTNKFVRLDSSDFWTDYKYKTMDKVIKSLDNNVDNSKINICSDEYLCHLREIPLEIGNKHLLKSKLSNFLPEVDLNYITYCDFCGIVLS